MRLIVVSNRLPVTVSMNNGSIDFSPSVGGLATGLKAYLKNKSDTVITDSLWLGWPGFFPDKDQEAVVSVELLSKFKCHPVFYSQHSYQNFYLSFCNSALWPLFHSLPTLVDFKEDCWNHYKEVNELFFLELTKIIEDGDIVWIHDFHLLLLPGLIRAKYPNVSIGFFLHIPFPPFENFRILTSACKNELLRGALGADIIGFHTHDYAQEFLKCVLKVCGIESKNNRILLEDRIVKIDTYPMGIDFEAFHNASSLKLIQDKRKAFRRTFSNRKLILSIDRLDYTKGILQRLLGYEQFLLEHPEWHQKLSLILILVPSRVEIESYKKMKVQIDEMVGKINGAFSQENWLPIIYQYKNKSFEELVLVYSSVDIALITPLRDGMNLIAKEFVASRSDKKGVLILSEMAGASHELLDAKIINPFHVHEIVNAIYESLTMSEKAQTERMRKMQAQVKGYDVVKWSEEILSDVLTVQRETRLLQNKVFDPIAKRSYSDAFFKSKNRLLLIDYDGTLVKFEKFPALAFPSSRIVGIIRKMAAYSGTTVIILSGRDRFIMEKWFGSLKIDLIAENGIWIKTKAAWQIIDDLDGNWKKLVIPVIERYVVKLPGSFIEEKEFSIVWHFRNSEIDLSITRKMSLISDLSSVLDLHVLEATTEVKSIEIRKKGISKGRIISSLLQKTEYDFIGCFGDDHTDENVFSILPETAFTFKVGMAPTGAQFILRDSADLQDLLEEMLIGSKANLPVC